MREGERHQRKPDGHHFRGAAAGAKIVKRAGRTSAEIRRGTCRTVRRRPPATAPDGTPPSIVTIAGGGRGQTGFAKRRESNSAVISASSPAATNAGAGVSAGASHATKVLSPETAKSDRPRRSARSEPGRRRQCWRRPTAATRRRQIRPLRTAMAASARIDRERQARRSARPRARASSLRDMAEFATRGLALVVTRVMARSRLATIAWRRDATGRAGFSPRRTDRE